MMPWNEVEHLRRQFEQERWVYYALGILSGVGLACSLALYFKGC